MFPHRATFGGLRHGHDQSPQRHVDGRKQNKATDEQRINRWINWLIR